MRLGLFTHKQSQHKSSSDRLESDQTAVSSYLLPWKEQSAHKTSDTHQRMWNKRINPPQTNTQIPTPHPIPLLPPRNPAQMQHQSPKRSIIRIRQFVDKRMQSIPPLLRDIDPPRLHKTFIPRGGEERVRKFFEEELEQRCNSVDVVEEVSRVAEI